MTGKVPIGPDGLPVVRPTRDRVDGLLATVDRAATDLVGPFPLSEQAATVETLATNAVMAGCAPEHFPVVLAALRASLAERFNLYGLLATTEAHWPSVVVNGPVREAVGLNGVVRSTRVKCWHYLLLPRSDFYAAA